MEWGGITVRPFWHFRTNSLSFVGRDAHKKKPSAPHQSCYDRRTDDATAIQQTARPAGNPRSGTEADLKVDGEGVVAQQRRPVDVDAGVQCLGQRVPREPREL